MTFFLESVRFYRDCVSILKNNESADCVNTSPRVFPQIGEVNSLGLVHTTIQVNSVCSVSMIQCTGCNWNCDWNCSSSNKTGCAEVVKLVESNRHHVSSQCIPGKSPYHEGAV